MSATSNRLFRAIDYRSRVGKLAVSGPSHAAYLSDHPEERSLHVAEIDSLERELAYADIEACDREMLLSELASCKKNYLGHVGAKSDGILDELKPTWRDLVVAAVSAYAAWKGRGWLEGKAEEFARMQAKYLVEEMKDGG